jgi:hypothetical protein
MKVVGVMLLLVGVASIASAALTTPEIDSSSAVSALALLSGGLLIFESRRKSRRK